MTKPAYRLLNAFENHLKHPKTFWIPSVKKRNNIKPGLVAKLSFLLPEIIDGYDAERMWVLVTGRKGETYLGTLENHPVLVEGLSFGDKIKFLPQHILDIDTPKKSKPPQKLQKDQLAIVSRRILKDGLPPGEITRDQPAFPGDSGWLIFSGDEDDHYMKHMEYFESRSLSSIIKDYPHLEPLLSSPPGTCWFWDDQTQSWTLDENLDH